MATITRPCYICGSSVTRLESRLKHAPRWYCSPECAHQGHRIPLDQRFWEKVDQSGGPDACWPWTAQNDGTRGYGRIKIGNQRKQAHRVAFTLTYGEITDKHVILHLCDNPPCCNPSHLRAGTTAENVADMTSKHRQAFGQRHPNSKLTHVQVDSIRKAYATGEITMGQLARLFGVTSGNIKHIINNRAWQLDEDGH